MRMVHDGDIVSLQIGGQTIEADKKGIYEVPDALVDELRGHGFRPEGETAPAPVAETAAALADWDQVITDLVEGLAALTERVASLEAAAKRAKAR